eukprot:tig00001718_g9584.t1
MELSHYDVVQASDLPPSVREAVAATLGDAAVCGGFVTPETSASYVFLAAASSVGPPRLFIWKALAGQQSVVSHELPGEDAGSYNRRITTIPLGSSAADFGMLACTAAGTFRLFRRPLRAGFSYEDGSVELGASATVECVAGFPSGALVACSDGALIQLAVPADPFQPLQQTRLARHAGIALCFKGDEAATVERYTVGLDAPPACFAGESPLAARLRAEVPGEYAGRWASVQVADAALVGGALHVLAVHALEAPGPALLSLHALDPAAVGSLPPPGAALWCRDLPAGALPAEELPGARLQLVAGRAGTEARPFVLLPSCCVLPDGELLPARPAPSSRRGPSPGAPAPPSSTPAAASCAPPPSTRSPARPPPPPPPPPRPRPGLPSASSFGGRGGGGALGHALRLAVEGRVEAARALARRQLDADPAAFARSAAALDAALAHQRPAADEAWAGAGPAPRGSPMLERALRERLARHDALAEALRPLPLAEETRRGLVETGQRLRAAVAGRAVQNTLAAAAAAGRSQSEAPLRLVEEAIEEAVQGRLEHWAASVSPFDVYYSEAPRLEAALAALLPRLQRDPYARPELAPSASFAANSFALALLRPSAILHELSHPPGASPEYLPPATGRWSSWWGGRWRRWGPGAHREGLARHVAELGAVLLDALALQGAPVAQPRAALVRALWRTCRDAARAMALAERTGDLRALAELLVAGSDGSEGAPLLSREQADAHLRELLARRGPDFAGPLLAFYADTGRTGRLLEAAREPELAGEVERLAAARPGLRALLLLQAGRLDEAAPALAATAAPPRAATPPAARRCSPSPSSPPWGGPRGAPALAALRGDEALVRAVALANEDLAPLWLEAVRADEAAWRELAAAGELPDAAARAACEGTLFFAAARELFARGAPGVVLEPLEELCAAAAAALGPALPLWLRRAAAEARADAPAPALAPAAG